jgi:hypothetical protein
MTGTGPFGAQVDVDVNLTFRIDADADNVARLDALDQLELIIETLLRQFFHGIEGVVGFDVKADAFVWQA